MPISEEQLSELRQRFTCSFEQVDNVFEECANDACSRLSPSGVGEYLDGASLICMLGRGFEPALVYLEEMPEIAERLGEETLKTVSQAIWKMSRTPNGKAILPLLQSLGEAARRLGSKELFEKYIEMVFSMMERTTRSVHGFHSTIPSPGLPDMLNNAPYLLNQLSLEGMVNWVEYGVSYYNDNPERQKDYFSLQSADSRAVMQRERHGTLFADVERGLGLYMKSLWNKSEHFVPYSTGFDELRKPVPYFDELGIRVPDVFDDLDGVSGYCRYIATLAHIAAHQKWTEAIFADNFSPFQRLAVEFFEDCRVELLAIREYPGLRSIWKRLHPKPIEGDCDPETQSCVRHRLAMMSYALIDDNHGYSDSDINEFVKKFHGLMENGESSTKEISGLAASFVARTRRQEDQSAVVYFDDTEIGYRDDNRHMWKYYELGDEEEMFDEKERSSVENEDHNKGLPPRHYPEWDYQTKTYRPDWVSVYESLHPSGDGTKIDDLLQKNSALAKQIKQLLDLLKPQQYVRVRYQEDGSDLDLDVAIKSLIDFKSGATPDPRINMSHRHDGRDIAVMLLMDLSQSIGDVPEGATQSILELSQEAVSILGWAIERLGDEFAIAGFSSNTRHEVRYQHLKGYNESWDDGVKSRLAAIEAGYSTRMGAALRHAGHYLSARKAEKKLLLVLSDGEPSDIDVSDGKLLMEDTRKAVQELDRDDIYTFCITLDAKADEYVGNIFGNRFAVVDKVERLPEKLLQLFVSITK